MATEEMFTSLPTVTTAQLTDIICAVQGYISPSNIGLSVQETLQQVYSLFQSNIILFNSGNPNGFVAGTTYQFCWDTLNSVLYICTISGSSSTAAWTSVINPINTNVWIPVFTFASPGDLGVVYTKQAGSYSKSGSLITATFEISCTPNYTTSSGLFQITGLPIMSNLTASTSFVGSVSLNGTYNLGTATWVVSSVSPGSTLVNLFSNQSNSASAPFNSLSFTSGNSIGITGTICYLQ